MRPARRWRWWSLLAPMTALGLPACGPRPRDVPPSDLRPIVAALDQYCLEHSDYPSALDDAAVRERLKSYNPSVEFTDRWGRPLEYRYAGPGAFELRSAGADGQPGTRDDIIARRGPPASP